VKAYHIKNKAIISNSSRLARGAITALTALLLLSTPPAFAHKLNMFAYAEGNEIFAEGYFVDGKRAKNSAVKVFDASNKELLQGTTDVDGQFSFAIPQLSDLRITINAGMGHQAEFTLTKDELSGEEEAVASRPPATPSNLDSASPGTPDGPLNPVTAINIDNTALRSEVERAVGKAIKPLMRELSAMRAEKSMADIIGGIGFIFGLFGIAMYFKVRKQ